MFSEPVNVKCRLCKKAVTEEWGSANYIWTVFGTQQSTGARFICKESVYISEVYNIWRRLSSFISKMQDDVKSGNFEASSLVIYFILLDIKVLGTGNHQYNIHEINISNIRANK